MADADSAGVAFDPVNNEQFAMGAIVHPAPMVPAEFVVDAHLSAGIARRFQQLLVHGARADPVEQDVNTHAPLCRLGQRLAELASDFVAKDERLERDAGGGALDGVEHRREGLVAVEQNTHVVAGYD